MEQNAFDLFFSVKNFLYLGDYNKCLEEISNMTVPTGLPKHLVMISVSAHDNLKYGIPEDFP